MVPFRFFVFFNRAPPFLTRGRRFVFPLFPFSVSAPQGFPSGCFLLVTLCFLPPPFPLFQQNGPPFLAWGPSSMIFFAGVRNIMNEAFWAKGRPASFAFCGGAGPFLLSLFSFLHPRSFPSKVCCLAISNPCETQLGPILMLSFTRGRKCPFPFPSGGVAFFFSSKRHSPPF